ncbi:hypothetical protein WA158_008526 [Blastocystis sp. Blastoise]
MSNQNQRIVKRGRTGIQNIGNTCFLASALQCLSHIPEFTHNLVAEEGNKNVNNVKNDQGMTLELHNFLTSLWSGKETSVNPKAILNAVAAIAPQLADGDQHDSHELLSFVLDGLSQELNSSSDTTYFNPPNYTSIDSTFADENWVEFARRNQTFLTNLFYGQFCTEIKCQNCQHVVTNFEPFEFLHLPLVQDKIQVSINIIHHSTIIDSEEYEFQLSCENQAIQVEKDDAMSSLGNKLNDIKNTPNVNYIFLEMKKDKKGYYKFYKVNTQFKVNFYFSNNTSIDAGRTLLAYPIPADTPADYVPLFLCNSFFVVNGTNYRALSLPQSLGIPLLIMCEPNESVGTLSNKVVMGLSKMIIVANERNNFISEDAMEVPAVYLFSNNVYNKGLSTFNKYCDIMADQSSDDSDIQWDSDTLISSLLPDKAEEIRFAVAVWDTIESNTNIKTEEVTINEELPLRIKETCSVSLLPFSEYTSEEELEQQNENKRITLEQCLTLFIQSTLISEQAIWKCSNCSQTVLAENINHLWRLPPILIIHLKRFEYIPMSISPLQNSRINTELGKRKINTFVEFPIDGLDLSPYLSDSIREQYDNNHCLYDLIAVSNHNGDANFGHYNAYCKDMNEGEEKWYDYNDSRMTSISKDQVCTKFGYILFYKRRDCNQFTTLSLINELVAYENRQEIPVFTPEYPYPFVQTEENKEEEKKPEVITVEEPSVQEEEKEEENNNVVPIVAATAATAAVATAAIATAVVLNNQQEEEEVKKVIEEEVPIEIDNNEQSTHNEQSTEQPIEISDNYETTVIRNVPSEEPVIPAIISQQQQQQSTNDSILEENYHTVELTKESLPSAHEEKVSLVQQQLESGMNTIVIDDVNLEDIKDSDITPETIVDHDTMKATDNTIIEEEQPIVIEDTEEPKAAIEEEQPIVIEEQPAPVEEEQELIIEKEEEKEENNNVVPVVAAVATTAAIATAAVLNNQQEEEEKKVEEEVVVPTPVEQVNEQPIDINDVQIEVEPEIENKQETIIPIESDMNNNNNNNEVAIPEEVHIDIQDVNIKEDKEVPVPNEETLILEAENESPRGTDIIHNNNSNDIIPIHNNDIEAHRQSNNIKPFEIESGKAQEKTHVPASGKKVLKTVKNEKKTVFNIITPLVVLSCLLLIALMIVVLVYTFIVA